MRAELAAAIGEMIDLGKQAEKRAAQADPDRSAPRRSSPSTRPGRSSSEDSRSPVPSAAAPRNASLTLTMPFDDLKEIVDAAGRASDGVASWAFRTLMNASRSGSRPVSFGEDDGQLLQAAAARAGKPLSIWAHSALVAAATSALAEG